MNSAMYMKQHDFRSHNEDKKYHKLVNYQIFEKGITMAFISIIYNPVMQA